MLFRSKNSHAKTEQAVLDEYTAKFEEAIADDLNLPLAIGVLWTMLKLPKSIDVYNLALKFDRVFALDFDKIQPVKEQIVVSEEVLQLAEQRLAARKAKNWAESDRLRNEIAEKGYAVKDTATGYEITQK